MNEWRSVLITDGGDQHTLTNVSTVRALALAGRRPVVTTCGGPSSASRSKYCAGSVEAPSVADPAYPTAIGNILREGNFLAALPSSDAAIVALGLPGSHLVDKREVSRRAMESGLPVLPEHHFTDGADMVSHADKLDYPVIVKCAIKRTIVPFHAARASSPADLEKLASLAVPLTVQPFVSDSMRSVNGVIWDGRLRAVMHQLRLRGWPREAGVDAASVTVEPDLDLEHQLEHVLRDHEGIFQAQFMGPYLVDINPRLYASLMVAVTAGINLPDIVCQLTEKGEEAIAGVGPRRARTNVRYRWIEGDLLHVVDGLRKREMTLPRAIRAFRPAAGTAHRDIPVSDTRAFIAHYSYRAQRIYARARGRRAP